MVFLAALAVIPEPTRVERNGGETPAQTFASLTSRVDCVTDPKIAAEGYELKLKGTHPAKCLKETQGDTPRQVPEK